MTVEDAHDVPGHADFDLDFGPHGHSFYIVLKEFLDLQ